MFLHTFILLRLNTFNYRIIDFSFKTSILQKSAFGVTTCFWELPSNFVTCRNCDRNTRMKPKQERNKFSSLWKSGKCRIGLDSLKAEKSRKVRNNKNNSLTLNNNQTEIMLVLFVDRNHTRVSQLNRNILNNFLETFFFFGVGRSLTP